MAYEYVDSIRMSSVLVNESTEGTFWKVTIRNGRKSMTIDFHIGPRNKNKPQKRDVMACVALDSMSCDQPFDDWCKDFGYSSDSIAALKIYNKSRSIRKSMVRVFGRKNILRIANEMEGY